MLPVSGYTITAAFGESSSLWSTTHTGLDFAAREGTPIVAVAAGTVTSTEYDGAYGNKTVSPSTTAPRSGTATSRRSRSATATRSTRAESIGAVGSTGNTTGPHLHLEVRPGGDDPVDPFSRAGGPRRSIPDAGCSPA